MKDRTEFKEYDKEKEQYSNKDPLSYGDEIEDDILEECLGMEEENDNEDDIDSPIDTKLLDQLMNMGYPEEEIEEQNNDNVFERLINLKKQIPKMKQILDTYTYGDVNNIIENWREQIMECLYEMLEYFDNISQGELATGTLKGNINRLEQIQKSVKYSTWEMNTEFIKIIEEKLKSK